MEDQKNESSTRNLLVSSCVSGEGRRSWSSWSREIPRKKRSVVLRKKIILKRFHVLLMKKSKNEGNPDESSTEEVLLNDTSSFIATNEIGLGGVLLEPSDSISA